MFNFGMLVGGVLGLAAGGMVSQWVGWRSAFFLVGLPGFLMALSIDRLRVPVSVSAEPIPPVRSLLKIPAYLAVLVGGMFVVFSSSAFATWGVEFSGRYHDMGVVQASLWLATVVLVASMGGVSDWDRWGKKKAYLTSVSIYTQLVEKEERDSTFSLTFCFNLVQAEKTTKIKSDVENWPSISIRHFVDAFGARVTRFLSIPLDLSLP